MPNYFNYYEQTFQVCTNIFGRKRRLIPRNRLKFNYRYFRMVVEFIVSKQMTQWQFIFLVPYNTVVYTFIYSVNITYNCNQRIHWFYL